MRPLEIDIRNLADKHRVSCPKLTRISTDILSKLKFKSGSLSVSLVTDRKIKTLNKKFLAHDQTTDVISLSYANPSLAKREILGEIFISLDTAKRVAQTEEHSFFYEVCFYLCHGILHLSGWDDNTPKNREKMWKKQATLLKSVGVS